MSNLVLVAPMQGWVAPLDEVPDPVFSERILGDGLAIDPVGSTLHAPCDGIVISSAKHAVTLRAANGAEILIHIGLETVALGGQGFISHAREGKSVQAGDPLLTFDLEFLAVRVKSLISPIVITNGGAFRISRRCHDREVAVGEFLMELSSAESKDGKAAGAAGGVASRDIVTALAHGLHARPAAVLSNSAKRFNAEVSLTLKGKQANAKSVAALMSLGVHCNDTVRLEANGPDADKAVAALADLIVAGLGETPVSVAVAPLPKKAASPPQRDDDPLVVRGVRAAPGMALGRAVHFKASEIAVAERGTGIVHETSEFQRALAAIRSRLELAASSGDRQRRDILAAHIALLDDPELHRTTMALIEKGKSAGFAWREAVRGVANTFKAMDDVRMRERASDLLDLERQLLTVLTGQATGHDIDLPPHAILIADELLPSELVSLESAKVAGFVTVGGGPTSHVAIIAAGMNVPALVGVGDAIKRVTEGAEVLLDADAGILRLMPDARAAATAKEAIAVQARRRADALANAAQECHTADGTRIEVFANLGRGPLEAASAVKMGAEGCGLLRTEFLFLDREAPPSEDEQFEEYQAIADALEGRPFILRTFDIGGDKPVPYLPFPPEENPALGLRGVRAGFWWPDLLRAQFAAALRVKPAGQCRIMLPMIASLGELTAARAILDALREERGEAAKIQLGVMIETPASAVLADQLAREADFLSIGTNDLTQYTLAMDRGHPHLANQIDALHPAVLRLIARTAEAAAAAGKMVGVCGGLAADPLAAPLLIGLGIGELSVPPPSIPTLKAAIHALTMGDCRDIAQQALTLDSPSAVRTLIRTRWPSSQQRSVAP
ncbi:MAG: phosphoenolpyruvate--protein phosphotransferase [Alphaproteobacteria bacterium]|nr:phosphoenolpyruvate--protein phosphotransferase [Alphaproteobacteria bacterium]